TTLVILQHLQRSQSNTPTENPRPAYSLVPNAQCNVTFSVHPLEVLVVAELANARPVRRASLILELVVCRRRTENGIVGPLCRLLNLPVEHVDKVATTSEILYRTRSNVRHSTQPLVT